MSTTDTPEVAQEASPRQLLRSYVTAKVSRLQGAYLSQNQGTSSSARATLSELRKGSMREDILPSTWEIVYGADGVSTADEQSQLVFPHQLVGRSDAPNRYEQAAYDALTMYAVHQQSVHAPMHEAQTRFAVTVGRFVRASTPSAKLRFDSLAAARTHSAMMYHLRSLITLLRSQERGFNYGDLAVDLFDLSGPATNQRVLLKWSRDFASGYNESARKATS